MQIPIAKLEVKVQTRVKELRAATDSRQNEFSDALRNKDLKRARALLAKEVAAEHKLEILIVELRELAVSKNGKSISAEDSQSISRLRGECEEVLEKSATYESRLHYWEEHARLIEVKQKAEGSTR